MTPTSRRLLDYWTDPSRERPLFFCQVEALETVMYLTECAAKQGDAWVANQLADYNAEANSGMPRIAMKMATGSGKTVVMAMLIAWHTLNRQADRSAKGFADAILVVAPGITIRDRLRPSPKSYRRHIPGPATHARCTRTCPALNATRTVATARRVVRSEP